jgi:plastocyanin
MFRSERSKIILGAILVLLVAILAFAAHRSKQNPTADNSQNSDEQMVTRQAAPSNVKVPEKGMSDVPKNVAIPTVTAVAGPGRNERLRLFEVNAQGNAYTPDTIIARKGDTVHLTIHAVDRDYNFTQPDYGFNVAIPKGSTQSIEMSVSAPGTFTFFCSTCENKNMTGQLIVAE